MTKTIAKFSFVSGKTCACCNRPIRQGEIIRITENKKENYYHAVELSYLLQNKKTKKPAKKQKTIKFETLKIVAVVIIFYAIVFFSGLQASL
ncbi:MAG: hypothetical protein WC917_02635 [Bacilli bacterium]|jgi:hypothetical protein